MQFCKHFFPESSSYGGSHRKHRTFRAVGLATQLIMFSPKSFRKKPTKRFIVAGVVHECILCLILIQWKDLSSKDLKVNECCWVISFKLRPIYRTNQTMCSDTNSLHSDGNKYPPVMYAMRLAELVVWLWICQAHVGVRFVITGSYSANSQ